MISAESYATVIGAIEAATQEVFSLMIGVEVSKTLDPPLITLDSGSICSGFTLSGALRGFASVSYSMALAQWITAQMLSEESAGSEQQVLDASGEVANMIVGNVKNTLENHLGAIQISTPEVTIVERPPEPESAGPPTAVSFRCRESVFTVSIGFREELRIPPSADAQSLPAQG
jgi:CheY-specific phosphatase CheX